MLNWLKSLLTFKVYTHKSLIIPEGYKIIGIKKGALDPVNRKRALQGEPFEFIGTLEDFIIAPNLTTSKKDLDNIHIPIKENE